MRRRRFFACLVALLLAWPAQAPAQISYGGVDDAQDLAFTPTDQTDWPGASWLPTGTAQNAFDFMAARLKNWFGFYDVVVDVTGSATPCKTAQAALRNWHDNSYSTWTGARNIWITGTASVTQTDLKDYGSYAVCLLAAGPSTSLDADGYPADGSIVFGTTRRLNLDLSGLQLNVSRVAMSKPLIAVKIGLGHEAAWNYEWGGQLSASLWLSGSPELQCTGTPTLKESATGTPTTTNVPAAAANRGYGWTATELIGKTITMTSGAANGQSRTITTNGTTDITVGTAFSVAPSAGDTFTVSAYWLASRVPQQPSTGEIFSGAGWPQQSCVSLVEHNYKRSGAVNFNPQLRSFHGGTSSNGAGSVGWVAVNSWIVDRGDYRSFGFAIGGMVYGNMISTLKSFTAEGMGYGLIFGDPGIDGSVPDSNYVEVPRGLKIGGGQLEGAYYSELVMYYGADITLRGMHIESEDANDRGLTAHVLIGAGTGAAADGYRPCWRDQDLPSGGSCTSAITATQSWIGVNIENSTLPTDRGRKAYRLSGWSAGKSSFISACAAASGTGGADMTVSGRGMKADVQQYDGWYGTDTVQVRLDGTGSYVDPWRIGDTVSCGGQTATIAAYAGHSAGLAFGPGAYIANSSNQASSRIGFDGSSIPNLSMADYEFRPQRASSSSAPTIISMYVPFVAHSTANARIDMSTAATAGSRTLYPPIGYPRRLVKLGGGLDRETRYMPAGTCIDTVFTPGAWNARSNTAGTYRGATTGCYAGTSYTQSGILRFDAATDNYVTRLDTIDAKSIVYASGTSERFAKDFTLLWRSASTNTGDVRWCYAVNCFAPASESPDLSFGTAVCTTATVPATSGNVAQTALALGISSTNNCAVGEVMQITIYRDADDAADTMTGTADLLGVIEERDTYLW